MDRELVGRPADKKGELRPALAIYKRQQRQLVPSTKMWRMVVGIGWLKPSNRGSNVWGKGEKKGGTSTAKLPTHTPSSRQPRSCKHRPWISGGYVRLGKVAGVKINPHTHQRQFLCAHLDIYGRYKQTTPTRLPPAPCTMHLGSPVVPDENMMNTGWSKAVGSNSISVALPLRNASNGTRGAGRSETDRGSG